MASLRITARAHTEASKAFIWDYNTFRKDGCSIILGVVICDETLKTETSFILDPYPTLEHTGDLLSHFEETKTSAQEEQTATTFPY
jgi:hypothetical protein